MTEKQNIAYASRINSFFLFSKEYWYYSGAGGIPSGDVAEVNVTKKILANKLNRPRTTY